MITFIGIFPIIASIIFPQFQSESFTSFQRYVQDVFWKLKHVLSVDSKILLSQESNFTRAEQRNTNSIFWKHIVFPSVYHINFSSCSKSFNI